MFQIIRSKDKIIVKVVEDPQVPADIVDFISEYKELLINEHKKKLNTPSLTVMFDLRILSVSLFQPKIAMIKILCSFFNSIQVTSEHVVKAAAVILSNQDMLISTITKMVQINPGKVPFCIRASIEECKSFLKKHI